MTVKLISHTGECSREDDTSLPFKLELIMRVPEFRNTTFAMLYGGSEDVVARADTHEELTEWMKAHGLDDHVRLSRWRILGPNGDVVANHRWEP